MCDNKPSRFNTNMLSSASSASSASSVLSASHVSTVKSTSSGLSVASIVSTSKILSKPLTLIDKFYDNRKKIFDICGNIINKDTYPFITILSTYLVDIVNSIDIEINKSTRNSMINWREKKNPKLLSKFINSDDNINIINRSMNKITSSNYMTIVKEISDTLTQDNFRKLPEYSKFLFDTIIKKCLSDEKFATDYLHFLVAFDGAIGKNINQYINEFISEVFLLMKNNNYYKCNDITSYFSYIKDVGQYMNIGIILANLYLIKIESNTALSNINMYLILQETNFYENFKSSINHINNYLEWLPSDMGEIIGRIYLVFGIIEIIGKKLLENISDDDINFLNDILTLIYNINSIPNKIKFKVLDIQDIIKTFNKNKKPLINKIIDIPNISNISNIINDAPTKYDEPIFDSKNIELPLINLPKKNKSINFSSLKLVQMQTNKTTNDCEVSKEEVSKSEVPKSEVSKSEVPKSEVPKSELISKDEVSNILENTNLEVSKVELNNKYEKNNKNNNRKNRNSDNKNSDNKNSDNKNSDNKNSDNKNSDTRNSDTRNSDTKNRDNKNRDYRNKDKNNKNVEKTNSNSSFNTSSTYNNVDDEGFIKIERKPRVNNELQVNNNFKHKNKTNN
jgi:hypothetical protein